MCLPAYAASKCVGLHLLSQALVDACKALDIGLAQYGMVYLTALALHHCGMPLLALEKLQSGLDMLPADQHHPFDPFYLSLKGHIMCEIASNAGLLTKYMQAFGSAGLQPKDYVRCTTVLSTWSDPKPGDTAIAHPMEAPVEHMDLPGACLNQSAHHVEDPSDVPEVHEDHIWDVGEQDADTSQIHIVGDSQDPDKSDISFLVLHGSDMNSITDLPSAPIQSFSDHESIAECRIQLHTQGVSLLQYTLGIAHDKQAIMLELAALASLAKHDQHGLSTERALRMNQLSSNMKDCIQIQSYLDIHALLQCSGIGVKV